MTISHIQVENIFKTLPTGYYVGRQVKNVLTDEQGSYYDLMNDEIHVSYPMIENVSKSLPDSLTIENDIRCLLYHEVSHALLTSKELSTITEINIFEDERIETVLASYYRGVDFKQFVKRVNNFHNEKPKTADEMYYQVVRYRVGPKQFTERVSSIINDYAQITRCSKWQIVYSYEREIATLYNDIIKYFDEQKQNENNSDSSDSQNNENENENEQQEGSSSNSLNSQSGKNSSQNAAKSTSGDAGKTILSDEQIKSLIETAVTQYDSIDYQQKINQILSNIKHTAKQTSSAINAYSGVFNPRSVVRNDFKWFVQQNRMGHVKAFSKIKLNLFIDCSGSFCHNDEKVNKLLKALIVFEKQNKDFSFDLISCGVGQKIRAKNDRIQHSGGGTYIDSEIINQFKQVQQADAQNINICLYDGYCASTCYNTHRYLGGEKYLATFNNNRSVLILDDENKQAAEKYCKNAKVIITNNYTEELDKNVFDALQALTH